MIRDRVQISFLFLSVLEIKFTNYSLLRYKSYWYHFKLLLQSPLHASICKLRVYLIRADFSNYRYSLGKYFCESILGEHANDEIPGTSNFVGDIS